MNKSMIRYLLAKLLLIEAMLLCVPIVVALLNLKNDLLSRIARLSLSPYLQPLPSSLYWEGLVPFSNPKIFTSMPRKAF